MPVLQIPLNHEKITRLAAEANNYDIAPIFFTHYLDTKEHPFSKLLLEALQECSDVIGIMDNEAKDNLRASLPPSSNYISPAVAKNNDEWLALAYVIYATHNIVYSLEDAVVDDLQKSRILQIYPELLEKIDDDGLLQLDNTLKPTPLGIEYKEHIFQYHQLFRRGYSSRINLDFISRFLKLTGKVPGNNYRIAIDHRRVTPIGSLNLTIEADYLYGAHFNPSDIDDPHKIGLTIHRRGDNPIYNLSNQIGRTEFLWSFRDGIKTCQIEEISDKDYSFGRFNLNRYTHSQRDTHRKILQHFDGAVLAYLSQNYDDRLQSKLQGKPRAFNKVKLFRVDGEISLTDWVELNSYFFRSNEMVLEYLDPEAFRRMEAATTKTNP